MQLVVALRDGGGTEHGIRAALGDAAARSVAFDLAVDDDVRDVNAFDGHIACDAASQSEIVVPLVGRDGGLLGVWDVDSPSLARFDADDRAGMERLCAIFVESLA